MRHGLGMGRNLFLFLFWGRLAFWVHGVSAPYLRNPSTLRPLYIGGSSPQDLPPLEPSPYLWTSPLPHDSAQLDIFGDQLELLKFLYVLWFSPSPCMYITTSG